MLIPLGFWAASGAGSGAATGAYELISTLTGSGNPTSFTFSSIPSTYKHLQLRVVARNSSGNAGTQQTALRLNSDSTTSYANHYLWGRSSTVQTGFNNATSIDTYSYPDNLATANIYATSIIDILDYTASTKNKTVKTMTGTTETSLPTIAFMSGLWPSTAAITSVTWLSLNARTFETATRVSLYGIKG